MNFISIDDSPVHQQGRFLLLYFAVEFYGPLMAYSDLLVAYQLYADYSSHILNSLPGFYKNQVLGFYKKLFISRCNNSIRYTNNKYLVGLVSLELVRDLGIADVRLGTVPVKRPCNTLIREDGDVLREVGCD